MPRVKISPLRTTSRAAMPLGGLLLLFAAVWYVGFHPTPWYAGHAFVALAAAGIVFSLVGAAVNLRWLIRAICCRRGLILANVALMTFAAGVILVFLNLISLQHYVRWDMTAVRKHTLDQRTLNVLSSLRGELKITAVFHADEETLSSEYPDHVTDLVNCYLAQSPFIHYEIINDIRQPDRARQFADQLGLSLDPNSIVFQYGGRTRVVQRADVLLLPKPHPGESADSPPKFFGEDSFTSTIAALSDPTPVRVGFATGHGERSPTAANNEGMERFAQRLRRENYTVETIDLFAAPEKLIGPDRSVDVLVLAGPTQGFSGPALEAIRGYLQRPGTSGLLVLARPKAYNGALGGLKDLLATYNLTVRDDVLVTRRSLRPDTKTGQWYWIISRQIETTDFQPHPITERLETLGSIFPFTGSVDAVRPQPAGATPGPVYDAKVLVRAPSDAWGETVFNESDPRALRPDPSEDLAGPVPLGAAMETRLPPGIGPAKTPAPRIVVFGGVDFAANKDFAAAPGNETLAANAVSWLAHRETRMGIRLPEDDSRRVAAIPNADIVTFMVTVVGLPALALLAGAAVWWRRRR